MKRLRIATRASELALTQARLVAEALRAAHLGLDVEILGVSTRGDRDRDRPVTALGGTGVFTREVGAALLDGRADLAVHSLKDLPTQLDARFTLAAVPERADARDTLVARERARLEELPEGARVGTSSARRAAQLLAARPDIEIAPLRGNVPTRVRKADSGEFDAIVTAAAALDRLGLAGRGVPFDPEVMLPAPGQGALAVEARADDGDALALARAVEHAPSRAAVEAERALLAALGGGCRAPVAALATCGGDRLRLRGRVLWPDGRALLDAESEGSIDEAARLGRAVAEELLRQGAREVLDAARG